MISEKEIIDIVDDYLLTYVGNLVVSGIPFFNSKERVWVVPIFHASSNETFPLDEMKLNENGEIIYAPAREKLIGLTKKYSKAALVQ
ncbi:MAG TPA: hypothetical protein VJJ76_00235 [archaeon]|nr:hypothetical protein [archaeon]